MVGDELEGISSGNHCKYKCMFTLKIFTLQGCYEDFDIYKCFEAVKCCKVLSIIHVSERLNLEDLIYEFCADYLIVGLTAEEPKILLMHR